MRATDARGTRVRAWSALHATVRCVRACMYSMCAWVSTYHLVRVDRLPRACRKRGEVGAVDRDQACDGQPARARVPGARLGGDAAFAVDRCKLEVVRGGGGAAVEGGRALPCGVKLVDEIHQGKVVTVHACVPAQKTLRSLRHMCKRRPHDANHLTACHPHACDPGHTYLVCN